MVKNTLFYEIMTISTTYKNIYKTSSKTNLVQQCITVEEIKLTIPSTANLQREHQGSAGPESSGHPDPSGGKWPVDTLQKLSCVHPRTILL